MGVEILWLGWLFWAGRKERLKEAPLRPSPKSHARRRLQRTAGVAPKKTITSL